MTADLWIIRSAFLLVFGLLSFHMRPFGLGPVAAVIFGLAVGCAIVVFEVRLRKVTLKRLIGAAVGSVLGILGAFMMSLVLGSSLNSPSASFLQLGVLLLMAYVGLVVGGAKGDMLNLGALGGLFGGEKGARKSHKILDTSVIIDGRIADVAETGFMDGVLVVPQFVLWELQLVADSADSLKRNRGRRGLDILQRLQKIVSLDVQIVENDYPKIKEVDQKLIQLAKDTDAKIVTNDFNLNKLAQLQGVPGPQHQRAGQLPQAHRAARRDHEGLHSQRGKRIQSRGRLSRRRHHGGGGQRPPPHFENHRDLGDQRVADHRRQNDFRALR